MRKKSSNTLLLMPKMLNLSQINRTRLSNLLLNLIINPINHLKIINSMPPSQTLRKNTKITLKLFNLYKN